MSSGRPSDYSPDLADEFCRRVASGRSVLGVCADPDMPSDTTVYRWRQEKAEFRDKFTRAREDRTEAFGEMMLTLASRVLEDASLEPHRVSVAVQAIDKAAARMTPRKEHIEITGSQGGPIETEEISMLEVIRRLAFILRKAQEEQGAEMDKLLDDYSGTSGGA